MCCAHFYINNTVVKISTIEAFLLSESTSMEKMKAKNKKQQQKSKKQKKEKINKFMHSLIGSMPYVTNGTISLECPSNGKFFL